MVVINLPWYKEPSYHSLQKLRIGDPSFRPTYQSWLVNTQSLEQRITGLGCKVIRFNVTAEEYTEWATIQRRSTQKSVDVSHYVGWLSNQSDVFNIQLA